MSGSGLRIQEPLVYSLLTVSSLLILLLSLGPAVLSLSPSAPGFYHYSFFDLLCHQDPARSFFIGEYQMAVCARCTGIYAAFTAGILSLPLTEFFSDTIKEKLFPIRLALVSIFINILDVSGNYFGFWSNTLTSRFLAGALMGLSAAWIMTGSFFLNTKSEDTNG